MDVEAKLIDAAVTDRTPHFEPYGWHHWPDHPWWSYQFRRGLGETQLGGGAVSECFQAAARMTPGDDESWYREWLHVAQRNHERGDAAGAGRPCADGAELLAPGRRLLPPGRVLARRRGPAPAGRVRGDGGVFARRAAPSVAARRGGGYPVRGRRRAVRLFRALALGRRTAAGADLHGRAGQHQGRDVVHAGAWRAGPRHLRADDRRAGPGRHAAAAQGPHPARLRSADRALHRLAGAARGYRPGAHRGVRLEPGRLLCGARRVVRAAAGRLHLARRDLVDPVAMGGCGRGSRVGRPHQMGVRRAQHEGGDGDGGAVHRRRRAAQHALPLLDRAWRLRRAGRRPGQARVRLCRGQRRGCDACAC